MHQLDGTGFRQTYKPPYLYDELLRFLSGRTIAGIDMVRDGEYLRTVRLRATDGEMVCGWLRVLHNPEHGAIDIILSESLRSVLSQVSERIRNMFDLNCDPDLVYDTLRVMNEFRAGLFVPGTRVPGSFNAYEMAVRAVLGQQITVKAASTLAKRFVLAFGTPVDTGLDGLTHIFPEPEEILMLEGAIESHLGSLGIIASRAKTIFELARATVSCEINLKAGACADEEIKKLKSLRGIGNWTAHYIAMRTLNWSDAFLETDAGIKKALSPLTPKQMLEAAELWRPYRSYATVSLWNSL